MLAQSMRRDVEALILNNEGGVAFLVLLDFREGYERKAANDRVRWCWDWMQMYQRVRFSSSKRFSASTSV